VAEIKEAAAPNRPGAVNATQMEVGARRKIDKQTLMRRILHLEYTIQKLTSENKALRLGLRYSAARPPASSPGVVRYVASIVPSAVSNNGHSVDPEVRTVPVASPNAAYPDEVSIDAQTLRDLWAARTRLQSIERDRLYAVRRKELEYEARFRTYITKWFRRH
jgi:hypothetical protein